MYQMTAPKDVRVAKSRYRTFVFKSDVEEFRKMWRRKGDSKED